MDEQLSELYRILSDLQHDKRCLSKKAREVDSMIKQVRNQLSKMHREYKRTCNLTHKARVCVYGQDTRVGKHQR
jgi:hypothetical protein